MIRSFRTLYSTLRQKLVQPTGFCRLERRLLKLDGIDAPKFLQGLITNDIQKLHQDDQVGGSTGQYAALLSAQGRVLSDIFVHRVREHGQPVYYIDCDDQVADRIYLHLQTYNLRTKTSIKVVDETEGLILAASMNESEARKALDDASISSIVDGRGDWNVRRHIIKSTDLEEINKTQNDLVLPKGRFHRERVLLGIPEGPLEIPLRRAIPLEYNIDFMGGIDFHKGCYLGQELIIRTHHRGVVRKRVMPLKLHLLDSDTVKPVPLPDPFIFEKQFPSGRLHDGIDMWPTEISEESGKLRILSQSESIGKLNFASGNIGLGMIRLDEFWLKNQRKNLAMLDLDLGYILADCQVPSWWPSDEEVFNKL